MFPEKWRGIEIWPCCKLHDEGCSTTKFFRCLRAKITLIEALFIAGGGMIGCAVKYPSKMTKKLFRP
jgi:hypothetical protein